MHCMQAKQIKNPCSNERCFRVLALLPRGKMRRERLLGFAHQRLDLPHIAADGLHLGFTHYAMTT